MKRSLLRVSRAKRELLQAKLRAEGLADSGVTGSGVQTIPRRADRQSHPLSFSQQRLWFLDQLEPGLSAYNIPTLLHLSGELEVPVLAQTLTEILRRHEVLRARFTNQDGRPHQTIAPLRPPTLPIVDLTALDKETREATARRWARREIGRPFDLAQGPLLRLALLRLEAERHLALLVVHHIVSDGWSMGVLVRDLGEIYRALRTGAIPRLAPLPIDYADFAAWQRQWLAGETLHQQLDFWKQQLTDLARIDLPTDRPRPAVQTYRGASERVDLGSELMPRLEALSRGAGGSTTLFMTVLAAFDVLLYRTTSQRDLAVGTPIANRNRAETEGLIGFFVNTLVLRTRLRGETDFLSLLRDVRRRTVAAYAHQDLPFDKLVEELEPDRDLSHTPLFQVMVSLHNAPPSPPDLPGLRLAQVPFDPETVMFDLMLNVAPDNGRWIAGLGYNQDLFDAVRVRRLLRHFHRLLEGIAADPGQILEGLPLLSHAEQHQLMTEANDTAMPEAAPCCLHEPFLTQARERPEAVAIRAGDRAVTYGELQARVHRLAHRLRRLGVGPEDRVAVFHRRSPDLLVALLGILEAGGTYVALDPAYPSERLAFMLADTAASVVLTEAALVDDLPASDDPGREISVLRLDADGPEIAREPATAPPPRASERHLAYLIYTSGSTGRPKGVAIEHRSAVAMLRWARGVFPPACLEAVLASTSVCFDLSIYEIFLPLATGGQVVLVDDALALLQPGTCSGITLINTVPSAMTELMRADAVPAGVEGVNLAGEPIAGELVRDLYARTSVRRVYNLYGPSEDTTYSTFSRLPAGTVATPPIGRPVGDSRAYLLDRSGQPVPSGVPGEIYLGGAGVARGYLDRPRQTAERFLPDPFVAMAASGVGERLYRTGDQAHWRDEGELTFLGRIDHQIKLRGFRIELGEIEAVLRSQPQVRQAVALVRQDLPGGPGLVAYATPSGAELSLDELMAVLRRQLPEYMVPAILVPLDELPLTANGKLDRKALPIPSGEPVGESEAPPATPLEEIIAGLYAEVLGVDRVSPRGHFFALGGHSLLAARLVSRLRQVCQVEISLRQLFEAPTVAGLATTVAALRRSGTAPPAPPPSRVPRQATMPLSFAQERLWFLDQLEPGTAAYNLPLAVRLRGNLNVAALRASLEAVVQRHEILRCRFRLHAGQPTVDLAGDGSADWAWVDLRTLTKERHEPALQGLLESHVARPFDLTTGPLMRALLVSLGEVHVFAVTMHHISTDGWSMGILVRELAANYTAAVTSDQADGPRSGLPALPIQYADYAVWQRRWLQGESRDAHLAWWRQHLSGDLPVLDLPLDRPRPQIQSFRGERVGQRLAPEPSTALEALGHRLQATLFMTLLAAYQLLLGRWSGQRDLLVGIPSAGRTRRETEDLIGFFINTLALRANLGGVPSAEHTSEGSAEPSLTFAELVAQTRATALDAFAHQEVPFEQIVADLDPHRDPSRTPLFQAFFNLLNLEQRVIELPQLMLEEMPLAEPPSKFDLTLYAAQASDGLRLELVYNADLFDRRRMEAFLDAYVGLVEQVVTDPDRPIDEYSLRTGAAADGLPTAERAQASRPLLADDAASLPALVATTAEAQASEPAVSDGTVHWSYGELWQRSGEVASQLAAGGLGRADRVAIYGERSAEWAAAVLGVSRIGATFLLLDPAYPTARLADHVHQAKPRGWLQLAEPPAELADLARRSCGDRQWHGPPAVDATPRSTPLPALPTPNDPAYVIFTSGSSGRPKGVLGSHRPVAAFLAWYRERFDLGKEDRFAALSGLGHDPLQRDLWTPLMLGAELRIPSPDLLTEPVELWRWLRREAISVLHLTPSLARFLLDSAPAGDYLPAVRLVLFGGEPLTYALVARFRERAPRATCVNVYGATETPQVMAFHIVEGNEAGRRDAGRVPLGHGRDSVDLVVTDPRGRVCAVGELGEIGVRSADLARGYLGDEPLTRERFVADPWTGNAHGIYRTGDLGRYLPGGAVEFVGRADQQVKIRGFRVEPAEVEAALATHRAVAEVTVIGRAEAAGDTRLVAYLAAREGHVAPDDTGLRAFLASRLPAPMVPSHFVTLDSLPRLPNRKIDRRALPEPQAHAAGQTYVAPRTRTEEQLAAVWSQVLGIERVGVHDDFFLLGGHSLIATRLAQRVRQTFGVELPLRRLFQSPTLVALAEWIDLAHRERQASAVELPTILPDRDHRHEPFPMTDVQQAYWIGRSAALELGDVATHSYLELEYPQLDCERFAAAWQRLIDRHAMLRAVMLPDGRQRVLEDLPPYEIATLDLRHRSPDEIAGALQAVRDELSHQVLDPERWPLFELRFTRLEDRVILHISRDALLYDAWSLVLLLRELVQLYREPSTPLEPLTLTFRDYVLAEEDLRQTDLYNRSVEYWQTRLDNLPPAPELPLAVDTASLRNPGFERRQGRLDLAGWQAIRQRAQLRGLSTSAVLLAAYGEVLASWSKSPRFTLNLTLFNRLPFHSQVDQLVGDFTSLTLLEIEVQPGESLEGRAQRLQARLWEDLDHRYVGGVWVMRQLARRQKDGLRARMPMVFTSTLGLRQEAVQGAQELAGRVAYNITQTPQVWLDHQVTETPEGLLFNWDSIAGLFPEGLVDGMFEAYQALLVDLAAGDGAWQAGDRCHTPAADLMLYDGVNSTLAPARVSPPPEGLLHQPFLGQVVRRTDAIAVVDDDLYLSYGALHRQACHLAHALRQLGARPNRLIAVVMDKGWEQVAAVLAILEAGAAYLPIDAELPAERRDVLLRQGEAEVVLTQPRWRHRLDWPSGVQVLSVDGEAPTEPPELGGNPATPTDLAYVIFTSGSTGMPKGVMIDHRGALNTCLDVNRRFAVGAEDRVLALSALNFDLSVYDIFGLLAAGGTIVLPAADRRRDPAHWTEQVRRHGVTLWNSVPALMEMLVEYSSLGVAGGITPLRLVLLSGDWIPVTLPQRLRALHAKADSLELISLGGATEASIWSILFPIGEVEPGWSSIPYGQPMDLQTFHVLDPALRPRPRWVPGELYIGGIGVAKGYWKDPQKTRHSFVTHPRTGEILYRTGDLGRYLADGNIEFLGREDFQVKIRGHRIELGEIEAALIRHPRVREGVVAAVGEARAGRRLVAYVVHGDAADPSAEDLAAELAPFLAEKLPSYMVPVAFVALEALPLSANGKVDRQALPTPDGLQPDRAAPYQAPRDATEERLAEIWSELLGVEQVGTADNFFELGGDSIQAIQLVTRLAQVGLRVTATAVFEHQTIADLAPEVQPLEAPVADAASTPVAGNGSPALDAQTAHEDALDTEGADLSDHDLEQFLADLDLPEGDSP